MYIKTGGAFRLFLKGVGKLPAILHHLACAKIVLREKAGMGWNAEEFYLGNLLPDMAADKESSHYRRWLESGWCVPDMNAVKAELYQADNVLLMGAYCHLYLDHFYLTRYLGKKYRFDGNDVVGRDNGVRSSQEYFFSKEGLYRDYSVSNYELLRDGYVSREEVWRLPNVLPLSGIGALDDRKELDWKKELCSYLSGPVTYDYQFLSYDEIVEMIRTGAESFTQMIS